MQFKLACVLFFLFPQLLLAGDFYTKGLQNKLLKEPQHGSEVVVVLDRGETVSVVKKDKFWNFIKSTKGEGWLPEMLLSPTPPKEKGSLLEKNVDISNNARKRASQFTSAGAARGLKEDSAGIFKDLAGYDFNALTKMEKMYVPNDEGLKYLALGLEKEK